MTWLTRTNCSSTRNCSKRGTSTCRTDSSGTVPVALQKSHICTETYQSKAPVPVPEGSGCRVEFFCAVPDLDLKWNFQIRARSLNSGMLSYGTGTVFLPYSLKYQCYVPIPSMHFKTFQTVCRIWNIYFGYGSRSRYQVIPDPNATLQVIPDSGQNW